MISNENSPVLSSSRPNIQHFFPANKPFQFQNRILNEAPPPLPRQSLTNNKNSTAASLNLPPKPSFMINTKKQTILSSKLERTQNWCNKNTESSYLPTKDTQILESNSSASFESSSTSSTTSPPDKKSTKKPGLKLDLKKLSNKNKTALNSDMDIDDDSQDFVQIGAPPTPNTLSDNLKKLDNLTPTNINDLPNSMCYPERKHEVLKK